MKSMTGTIRFAAVAIVASIAAFQVTAAAQAPGAPPTPGPEHKRLS